MVIRLIDEQFEASEDFLGMYHLQSTAAERIVAAIKDILLHYQIPFINMRGQCYYECSTMAGTRGVV